MAAFIIGIILALTGVIVYFSLKATTKEEPVFEGKTRKRDEDGNYVTETVRPYAGKASIALIVGALLFGLLTFIGCTASVEAGYTGVVTTFGAVEDYTFDAGFHMKAPWNTVIPMVNRVQRATVELSCFSSDIQEVNMCYTLNYQIDASKAEEIYRSVGTSYYTTIVEPTISEAVKVATAKYTAEKLVQTRSELAESIESILIESLKKYNIKVSSTAIEDMDFTEAFTTAVEAKQVAEQKKKQAIIEQEQALLKAENDKQIATKNAEADAEVARTRAEADAEVARIKAEADREVAQIGADSAEYQGKKDSAVALQRLAGINGWTVSLDAETGLNRLLKADGTEVSAEELKIGTQKLIEYYYIQQWDGVLPQYYVGSDNASSIIVPDMK